MTPSFSTRSALAAAAVLLPAVVNAHGIVRKIDVSGGASYQGPLIQDSNANSPIWHVINNSPSTTSSDPNMFCGSGATPASQTPEVAAGSTLAFWWKSGYADPGSDWPHVVGPVMTYMAKCEGDCASMNSGNAKFFLIDAKSGTGDTWDMAKLHEGQPLSATIPADLAPGNYLIRHEIIALHSGHEYYPSCSQWKVTGSGSLNPTDTVAFPNGGYDESSPSLQTYPPLAGYKFPGHLTPVGGSGGQPQARSMVAAADSDPHGSSSSNTGSHGHGDKSCGSYSSDASDSSDCNGAWEKCNSDYSGKGKYSCQTEYVDCVSGSSDAKRNAHRAVRGVASSA